MNKIRMGLIGAGGLMGRGRATDFRRNPRSRVVMCSCSSPHNSQQCAAELRCRAAANWRELVADHEIDAVCISLPNTLHYEVARGALEHGKHVLVEYPLAQTLAQVDDLKKLADRRGLVLHHGLNTRLDPLYLGVEEVLPDLGNIACARLTYFGGGGWYAKPDLVGDMFLALHIHFIDYYRGWFGEAASLRATRHETGRGDHRMHGGTVLMEMERCPAAYMEFGMGYPGAPAYTLQIVGSKATLTRKAPAAAVVFVGDTKTRWTLPKANARRADSEDFLSEIIVRQAPRRTWVDQRLTLNLCLDCTRSAARGEQMRYRPTAPEDARK